MTHTHGPTTTERLARAAARAVYRANAGDPPGRRPEEVAALARDRGHGRGRDR